MDVLFAGFLLYLGVWIYELANWASLTLLGLQSSLTVAGVFPLGVSGISSYPVGMAMGKPLQVAMAVSTVSTLLFVLRKTSLTASKFALVGTISTYCATVLWEALSISWVSTSTSGQVIFASLDVALMLLMVKTFGGTVGLSRRMEAALLSQS